MTQPKKIVKERAQDELMHALQTAFNDQTLDSLRPEMSRQFARIEKLLGYKPFSWTRGV